MGVLVAAVLLAACGGSQGGSEGGTSFLGVEAPDPNASPTGDPTLWERDPSEPFPFVTPVPPRRPTPVDGLYARNYLQGSEPIPCRRCAPFRLDRGVATLEMRAGRYHLVHELNGFRTDGHYVIDGDRITLFNDPNCPDMRGEYLWTLVGNTLAFRTIADPCPFDFLRARYLVAAPWRR